MSTPPGFPTPDQPGWGQQGPGTPPPSYGPGPYGAPPPGLGGTPLGYVGYGGYGGYGDEQQQPAKMSGLAITGFVLGLVALVPCFWFWILQIPGLLGLGFSFAGIRATGGGRRKGRGLAIAGLVMSMIAIAIALAVTAFIYTSDDCIVNGPLQFDCEFDSN